jgi:hypothetical protein
MTGYTDITRKWGNVRVGDHTPGTRKEWGEPKLETCIGLKATVDSSGYGRSLGTGRASRTDDVQRGFEQSVWYCQTAEPIGQPKRKRLCERW